MPIENFMESLDDFKHTNKISEAEKQADENQKIKDMMEKSKEAKKKATEAKSEYDKLQREKADADDIEIALLKYKRHKANAEMLAADAKLLKKGKSSDDKGDKKEAPKKEAPKKEEKKDGDSKK